MPHSVLTITQILALLAADYDLKTEMRWNDKKSTKQENSWVWIYVTKCAWRSTYTRVCHSVCKCPMCLI